ncbi:adenylate/guanylate cyclase domain-containing protein [Alsobacter sp. SYSU M60028]|uniref:Adenylate/guanylate cyclase domain-containing protein n=1 Tax=Alsobacter ponti TaxID=2962936 RepID=A0ABT1L9J9_9HYPH|nr:adenylate/guanylate cyclase domain-containing protein [Alsobacter ponti]MCP8938149.1 adenylate/guanylate cyclase domain-containing protein [Alsobacter ponti]
MNRLHISALAVGAIFVGLCAGLRVADPMPARIARELLFDQYQRLQPRAYEPLPIRILDIDEASLATVGQWPWPRDALAKIVTRLREMGAASVAFDMVLAEPDRLSPASLGARPEVRDVVGPAVADALQSKLPDNDAVFAKAIEGSNVVLGFGILPGENATRPPKKGGLAFTGLDPARSIVGFGAAVDNLPALDESAAGLGAISISPQDNQGIVRQVPLIWSDGQRVYPSLALEALRVAQGVDTLLVRSTPSEPAAALSVRAGDVEAPTTARGEFRVYFTRETPERYVSIARFLQDPPDESLRPLVENSIVFIGTSAVGLLDVRTTPLGETVPGVSVHAQVLEQALSGKFLLRPDWVDPLETLLVVVFGISVAVAVTLGGPMLALGLGGLLALGLCAGSWFAFSAFGLLIDPVFALGSSLVLHFSLTSFRYLVTDRDKRFVRRAFGRYVSPAILARLEENPQALRLGGEERDLTILFLDIRSFTSLSETLSPTELIEFLNRVLGQLSEVIVDQAGTIDKYIGDSIMAFWNAPLDVPDHAKLACLASLRLRDRLAELNASDAFGLHRKGYASPNIRIGIGINRGSACVGNMGSEHHFNYSVVGDAVNVSARVQGLTKELGVDCLVTETVHSEVPAFAWLEAGEVELRGRHEQTRMFILVGDEAVAQGDAFHQLAREHAGLVRASETGDVDEIERRLVACARIASRDFPMLDLFYEKCRERLAPEPAARPELRVANA